MLSCSSPLYVVPRFYTSGALRLQADLFTLNIPLHHVSLLGVHLGLLLTQNALSLSPSSLSLRDAFLLPAAQHTSSLSVCRFVYCPPETFAVA